MASLSESDNSPDLIARLRRLRIQHLRLLVLLEQLGSLTACAKVLHLSQPAVSNLRKDLETVFGTTLVERDARAALSLSPFGQCDEFCGAPGCLGNRPGADTLPGHGDGC